MTEQTDKNGNTRVRFGVREWIATAALSLSLIGAVVTGIIIAVRMHDGIATVKAATSKEALQQTFRDSFTEISREHGMYVLEGRGRLDRVEEIADKNTVAIAALTQGLPEIIRNQAPWERDKASIERQLQEIIARLDSINERVVRNSVLIEAAIDDG